MRVVVTLVAERGEIETEEVRIGYHTHPNFEVLLVTIRAPGKTTAVFEVAKEGWSRKAV